MKSLVFDTDRILQSTRIFPVLFGAIALYYFLLVSFGYQSVKYIAVFSLALLFILKKDLAYLYFLLCRSYFLLFLTMIL